MNAPADHSDNCGKIIFVTGPSRSGTTLVCRVLGNQSRILALNEMQFFGEFCDIDACAEARPADVLTHWAAMLLARQARDFWVDAPTAEERANAAELVAGLPAERRTGAGLYAATVAKLAADAGKVYACEQTPRNIFYAERLLEYYPEARIIYVVRDPRAVLASQKNRWRMRGLGGANMPFSEWVRLWFNYHPVTMSSLWTGAMTTALALEQHPHVRLLRFESLVTDPAATVRELCDWLEVRYEPAMLDVPQWGSSNIRHGSGQGVSANMAGKWREVLTPGEVCISERRTGQYFARFGYERMTDGRLTLSAWLQLLLRYPLHVLGAVITNPRRVLIQLKALLRRKERGA